MSVPGVCLSFAPAILLTSELTTSEKLGRITQAPTSLNVSQILVALASAALARDSSVIQLHLSHKEAELSRKLYAS